MKMDLNLLRQAKSARQFLLPTHWQQLPNGERYFTALQTYFSLWSTKILGYQILKLGGLSGEISFDLPLRHQITLLPDFPDKTETFPLLIDQSIVQSQLTELPFIEKSINACVLANTLNFCADPHQLLREVQRVIADDGYLFISLFEFFSPLLCKAQLRKGKQKFAFRQFPRWRVLDWLALLDFEIVDCQRLNLKPYPQCFSPLTVIVARKQTYPLTLNPEKVRFKNTEFLQPANVFKEKAFKEKRA